MKTASRVNVDSAGGLINSSPQNFVNIQGNLWACNGSNIAAHGDPLGRLG